MKENAFIASLNGEVIMVAGDRAPWFESCLQSAAMHPKAEELLVRADNIATSEDDGFWPPAEDWRAAYRPYNVKAGILSIPVMGVLLNRMSFSLGTWATGYTYIERALRRGMEDPEVKGIAFICDSPGGEVSGCFELVDKIFSYRGQKRMQSFAADRAYSAAYAIACAADKVTMVRTGGVGSIGVMTLHLDFSEQLNQMGVKATFIKAGKYKTDGNHLEPLTRRAEARIQSRIDRSMDIFVASVSRNRELDEQVIRDFEADCFGADEALANGLADSVQVYEDALVAFTELCYSQGEDDMTKPNEPQAITQAQLDEAVATATASARAEGVAEGQKQGAVAERARISAIVGHADAKGKGEQALALALESDMTAEAVIKVLPKLKADAPVTVAGAPVALAEVFNEAMRANPPEVGAGGGEGNGGEPAVDADAKASQSILSAYRGATGAPAKQKAAA